MCHNRSNGRADSSPRIRSDPGLYVGLGWSFTAELSTSPAWTYSHVYSGSIGTTARTGGENFSILRLPLALWTVAGLGSSSQLLRSGLIPDGDIVHGVVLFNELRLDNRTKLHNDASPFMGLRSRIRYNETAGNMLQGLIWSATAHAAVMMQRLIPISKPWSQHLSARGSGQSLGCSGHDRLTRNHASMQLKRKSNHRW